MKMPYVDEPKNAVAAVQFFQDEASQVDELDYGDCMREWNRELLYLREQLKNTTSWAQKKLDQMQDYIQFTPNWDVNSTRARILRDASELKQHLKLNEMSGRSA